MADPSAPTGIPPSSAEAAADRTGPRVSVWCSGHWTGDVDPAAFAAAVRAVVRDEMQAMAASSRDTTGDVATAEDVADLIEIYLHRRKRDDPAPARQDAQAPTSETWRCAARHATTPEPQDCDWPSCGCDPQANKVIASLIDSGDLPSTLPGPWRLIKTAPRDGTHVLVGTFPAEPGAITRAVAHWFDGEWALSVNYDGEHSNHGVTNPTHWQHLPVPPASPAAPAPSGVAGNEGSEDASPSAEPAKPRDAPPVRAAQVGISEHGLRLQLEAAALALTEARTAHDATLLRLAEALAARDAATDALRRMREPVRNTLGGVMTHEDAEGVLSVAISNESDPPFRESLTRVREFVMQQNSALNAALRERDEARAEGARFKATFASVDAEMREQIRTAGFHEGVDAAAKTVETYGTNIHTPQIRELFAGAIRALTPPAPAAAREADLLPGLRWAFNHVAARGGRTAAIWLDAEIKRLSGSRAEGQS